LGISVFQERGKQENQEKHPWNKARTNSKLTTKLTNNKTRPSKPTTNGNMKRTVSAIFFGQLSEMMAEKQPHVGLAMNENN